MQYIQHYDAFEFDVKMGLASTDIMVKYHLDDADYITALDFLNVGNTLELEKLLGSRVPEVAVPASLPVPINVDEAVEKPEYGYLATPRHGFMFVKPLPPEHKGRLITPKAYEANSDMGFVHAIGPDVL